jgi:hypothetical protein
VQLHKILGSVSFITGLLGAGGIGGAIDRWTSPVAAITLLGVSVITGYAAYRESGERRNLGTRSDKSSDSLCGRKDRSDRLY